MQSYGDYQIDKRLVVKSTSSLEGAVTVKNGGLSIINGANQFVIDTAGNLTTPDGEITAKRLISVDGLSIISNATSRMIRLQVTSGLGMALLHVSGSGEGTLKFIAVNQLGAQTKEYGYIDKDGLLYWNGDINAAKSIGRSDRAFKENEIVMEGCLAKVRRVKGKFFDWKATHKSDGGFIAQEVEKEFEWAVMGQEGQKGVNYQGLVAPAYNAIDELASIVESQASQIEELKALVASLAEEKAAKKTTKKTV